MTEAQSYTAKVAIVGIIIVVVIMGAGLLWWDTKDNISDLDQAYFDALDGCAEDFTGIQFDKCFTYTKKYYQCYKDFGGQQRKNCTDALGGMMD